MNHTYRTHAHNMVQVVCELYTVNRTHTHNMAHVVCELYTGREGERVVKAHGMVRYMLWYGTCYGTVHVMVRYMVWYGTCYGTVHGRVRCL